MYTEDRPVERRISRNPLPCCEQCASLNVQVAVRVNRFLYVRCCDCFHVWSVQKCGLSWEHYTTGQA
jgi:hypothetical protein